MLACSSVETRVQLSSKHDMWFTELSSSRCAGIGVPLNLRPVSQGISGVA